MSALEDAAEIIGSFLSTNLMEVAEGKRKFTYGWERRGLAWLSDAIERAKAEGSETFKVNAWAYDRVLDYRNKKAPYYVEGSP